MPGGGELFFIVLVIIMLFGSKKIPELARGLGKGMREIKNATGDIQREIREGARDMNVEKDGVDLEKQVKKMIKNEIEPKESDSIEEKIGDDAITQESKTIQRRGSYNTEKHQNPTDNS